MRFPSEAILAATALLVTVVQVIGAAAAEVTRFPALQREEEVLSVHAATDLSAMEPLIQDFQALSPNVTVEYSEYLTNELFAHATTACAAKQASMDLILSSSVDHL